MDRCILNVCLSAVPDGFYKCPAGYRVGDATRVHSDIPRTLRLLPVGHNILPGDPQIRIYDGTGFRQLLAIGDRLVLVSVVPVGSVEDPRLRVRLVSESPLSRQERAEAGKVITSILNMRLDLVPFYQQVADDPILGPLCTRLRGLRSPRTPTVFESLIGSVIEQQISLPAAHSIEGGLVERTGRSVERERFRYFAFPRPASIASLSPEDLRECGLSRRKTEYIIGISQSIVTGTLDLEGLASVSDTPGVISRLMEVRDVGRWTAELTALRGLCPRHCGAPLKQDRNGPEISNGNIPVNPDSSTSQSWGRGREGVLTPLLSSVFLVQFEDSGALIG
jgi:DNA-3-methyladenine glycosylase II